MRFSYNKNLILSNIHTYLCSLHVADSALERAASYLTFLMVLWASSANADLSRPEVSYAGVAYLGDYEFIQSSYPLSLALNHENADAPYEGDLPSIDERLRTLIGDTPPKYIDLYYGLGDINKSKSLAMAVAIDRELVSVEQFKIHRVFTKIVFDVSAQLLFFDFHSMSLVNSVPIQFAANHTVDGKKTITKGDSLELAKLLYFSEDGFLHAIVQKLKDVRLKELNARRFQLTSVNLHERVLDKMACCRNNAQFKQYVGQLFTTQLASQYAITVLPYNRGYGLGNQLPGRFANGNIFSLKVPESDFEFGIDVKNFSKQKKGHNLIYGTQINFSFTEPFRDQTYIKSDYRYGVHKIAAENRLSADDWAAYEDAIESLLSDLVSQLAAPARAWHKAHAREPDSYSQFKKKEGLFNE